MRQATLSRIGVLISAALVGPALFRVTVTHAEPTARRRRPAHSRETSISSPATWKAACRSDFASSGIRFRSHKARLDDPSSVLNLWDVTFPSPVITPHPNNNTVHCEYFQPVAPGKHPGVIVLHILGGDFALSRLFCRGLAHHGVAALFVKMPYYGPRRQPDVKARMVSLDPHETVRGMTQAVLDVRQATAWLGSRAEIDADQLGILGISLGGITAALASSAEPRLQNICLILAGGDIGEVAWNAPHLKRLRERWLAEGGTKESLIELLRPVDPATNAAKVRGRRILMLNAAEDEVIPHACTESLWRALGQPEIVWWNAGHYSAAQYIFEGLARAVRFFSEHDAAAEPAAKKPAAKEPAAGK